MSQKPFEPSSSVMDKMKHVVGIKKRQQALQDKMRSLVQVKQQEQTIKNPPKQTPIVLGPRAGRNDPCPCGSGKKYKKCCLSKEKAA